jgi:hypothetical protein
MKKIKEIKKRKFDARFSEKQDVPKEGVDKKLYAPGPVRPRHASSWTIPVAVIIAILLALYGVASYVMHSEPYTLSESFIRQSKEIKAEIGDVDKADPWYPIAMYPLCPEDQALFTFDVIGTNKTTTEVSLSLQKKEGQWRVVGGSFKDRKGLMKKINI